MDINASITCINNKDTFIKLIEQIYVRNYHSEREILETIDVHINYNYTKPRFWKSSL